MRAVLAVAALRPLSCLAPFGVFRSASVGASRLSPSLLGRGCRPSHFLVRKFAPLLKDCTLFALHMSLIFSNFA